MKLRNMRQRFARRLTWTLGIVLLPLACYGVFARRQLAIQPMGSSQALVRRFTQAIQAADWHTARSCYADTPQLEVSLASVLDFPQYGPLYGFQSSEGANYYLPFSGEHEVYGYRLSRERHAARLVVDTVLTGRVWKIDSVRLSPSK